MEREECKVESGKCKVVVNFLALLGNFRFLLKVKQLESLIKLFKVCGFSRQSLEPHSAECGILSFASNRLRPAGCLEGVKSSLRGRFLLLHSFSDRVLVFLRVHTGNFAPA